jgi:hypothetical protein
MGDRRKCETYAASRAERGGLPVMLAIKPRNHLREQDFLKDCVQRPGQTRRRSRLLLSLNRQTFWINDMPGKPAGAAFRIRLANAQVRVYCARN